MTFFPLYIVTVLHRKKHDAHRTRFRVKLRSYCNTELWSVSKAKSYGFIKFFFENSFSAPDACFQRTSNLQFLVACTTRSRDSQKLHRKL